MLTRFEKRCALSIFDAIFPANAHPVLKWGAKDVGVMPFLDDYLRYLPPLIRRNFRLILFVVTWFPFFFVGRPMPVHWLSPATRERYLGKLARSRIYIFRQAILLLKSTAGFAYFRDQRVRAALGITYSADQVKVLGLAGRAPDPSAPVIMGVGKRE